MASSSVHDPIILDVLSAVGSSSLDTEVYRAVFRDRDPVVGSLAGGRWAPPQTYEVLYTSTEESGAIAEVYFHLRRQPIFPQRKVDVHRLHISTDNALDLCDRDLLDQLGLDEDTMTALDYEMCRDIGHAAEFLGFDALIVPSGRHDAANVVILLSNYRGEIQHRSQREVDWKRDV